MLLCSSCCQLGLASTVCWADCSEELVLGTDLLFEPKSCLPNIAENAADEIFHENISLCVPWSPVPPLDCTFKRDSSYAKSHGPGYVLMSYSHHQALQSLVRQIRMLSFYPG